MHLTSHKPTQRKVLASSVSIIWKPGKPLDLGRSYFRSVWKAVYRFWTHGIWVPKINSAITGFLKMVT